MIVSIKDGTPSAHGPMEYNDDKVKRGVAEILHVTNSRENTRESFVKTVDRLENHWMLSKKTKTKGFHLAISPASNETMTDEEAIRLATKIMDDIGYASQPWIMYKHTDTGHTHYHIVSTRCNEDGYVIPDWRKGYEVKRSIKEHAEEFNYHPGKDPNYVNEYKPVKKFNVKHGDVIKQFNQLTQQALSYDFTSFDQFVALMMMLNIRVRKSKYYEDRFLLMGLNENREISTAPQYSEFNKDISEKIRRGEIVKFRADHADKVSAVEDLVAEAFYSTESREAFREYLRGKSIMVSWGPRTKKGEYREITYMDTRNKVVVGHSEFSDSFSLRQINEDIVHGNWWEKEKRTELSRHHQAETLRKVRQTAARKTPAPSIKPKI